MRRRGCLPSTHTVILVFCITSWWKKQSLLIINPGETTHSWQSRCRHTKYIESWKLFLAESIFPSADVTVGNWGRDIAVIQGKCENTDTVKSMEAVSRLVFVFRCCFLSDCSTGCYCASLATNTLVILLVSYSAIPQRI